MRKFHEYQRVGPRNGQQNLPLTDFPRSSIMALEAFYMQCQVGRVAASGGLNGSEEGRQPDCMKLRGRGLHWYDVMALTVAGTSALAFVVMVVVLASGLLRIK